VGAYEKRLPWVHVGYLAVSPSVKPVRNWVSACRRRLFGALDLTHTYPPANRCIARCMIIDHSQVRVRPPGCASNPPEPGQQAERERVDPVAVRSAGETPRERESQRYLTP
jgi:hypothetical protein